MNRRGQALAAVLASLVVLVLGAIFGLPVFAQAPAPTLTQAELRLWPEYDDPGLLVIFSGSFADDTVLPLQVAFPAPAGARNVQATYLDASGTLINRPFEIQEGKLTYELPTAAFHTEYYLDRAPSGDQRTIQYTFEAPYPIDALRVAIQQPARATGFTLTPAAESSETGSDGLTYHVFTRRNVAAGEQVEIEISYSKPDTGLTAPQLAVTTTDAPGQAGQAASAVTPVSTADWLPWLLIGLGVILLVGILAYWLTTRRREAAISETRLPAAQARPRSGRAGLPPAARSVTQHPAPSRAVEAAVFCTNCGAALQAEDRFCSQCGTPRRS